MNHTTCPPCNCGNAYDEAGTGGTFTTLGMAVLMGLLNTVFTAFLIVFKCCTKHQYFLDYFRKKEDKRSTSARLERMECHVLAVGHAMREAPERQSHQRERQHTITASPRSEPSDTSHDERSITF